MERRGATHIGLKSIDPGSAPRFKLSQNRRQTTDREQKKSGNKSFLKKTRLPAKTTKKQDYEKKIRNRLKNIRNPKKMPIPGTKTQGKRTG